MGRELLIEGETCPESLSDKSKQRPDAQRQKGSKLLVDAELGYDVERVYCGRLDAFVENKRCHAYDDMRFTKHLGILMSCCEDRHWFTGIISDVYGNLVGLAQYLCSKRWVNLIFGTAFAGKD
ncbi:hypothetical protein SAMN05444170_5068 [Bradyrhizobium erythrophlei]|uniref:Uncharacterized protein n=1 Tax=Bradyrhizobium erythrophlei TaxID=1437360 RepID=A0A1M7UH78_9BRAD|nr:hypothetical protein SAMN05444170_5068 [Bradyrhizobium erythrophlei]